MARIAELNEKHAALLKQVRELRDEYKDKTMPAEKVADMDRWLDEADGLKAQLESMVAAAEAKKRLDEHAAWSEQSAGALPGMGKDRPEGDAKLLPGVESKSGFVGVKGDEGAFVPLWRQ